MDPQGKGFFTWKLSRIEGGEPQAIAAKAKAANLSYVLVKIADGGEPYQGDFGNPKDYVTPTIQALRGQGIGVWGWHYVYGNDPVAEAEIAIRRIKQYDLELYVIDAEQEYQSRSKAMAARRFMLRLRAAMPNLPVALCSYRYPSLHSAFPWQEFLERCDYNMPQVYWIGRNNPAAQLERCFREFQSRSPARPMIPVGAAFRESGWQPTPGSITEFLHKVQDLNLSAACFWEWYDACSGILPGVWDTVCEFPWSTDSVEHIGTKLIRALNRQNLDEIVGLYHPAAIHISAERTVQGQDAIRDWYANLLQKTLPQATFTVTGFTGKGNSYYLTWAAKAAAGLVHNGKDTIAIQDGKIAYHYTFFSVTKP
jgi:hypothetical protein